MSRKGDGPVNELPVNGGTINDSSINDLIHNRKQKPTVLVVDDQVINIRTLYEFLKSDYEVCMAMSGQEALDFCAGRLPDLILLDVVMPGMGGYEVCHRLKRNDLTRDIPIIFVTAQNAPAQEAQGLNEGAVDFISKPVHETVVQARVRNHLTLKFQSEQLRALAMLDGLTGVANRRQFDRALEREWRQCKRSGSPLAVVMIDIDFFKRFNDCYGHQAGDACIQAVAAMINRNVNRPHDLVARYGGEEFACIMPDTPLAGAQQKACELEQLIRQLGISHERSNVADVVTLSLGVAALVPDDNCESSALLMAADECLYAAKRAGRGQVMAKMLE